MVATMLVMSVSRDVYVDVNTAASDRAVVVIGYGPGSSASTRQDVVTLVWCLVGGGGIWPGTITRTKLVRVGRIWVCKFRLSCRRLISLVLDPVDRLSLPFLLLASASCVLPSSIPNTYQLCSRHRSWPDSSDTRVGSGWAGLFNIGNIDKTGRYQKAHLTVQAEAVLLRSSAR